MENKNTPVDDIQISTSISFSMNGFRSNLVDCCQDLRVSLENIFEELGYVDDDAVENFNSVACMVNSLLCVSSDNDPNFNDMSEHYQVKMLEEE